MLTKIKEHKDRIASFRLVILKKNIYWQNFYTKVPIVCYLKFKKFFLNLDLIIPNHIFIGINKNKKFYNFIITDSKKIVTNKWWINLASLSITAQEVVKSVLLAKMPLDLNFKQ